MQSICINNQGLAIKEYQGQRVVTFKDIDSVHQRPTGTASRNFKQNRKHFIENEDYFLVKPDTNPMDEIRPLIIPPKGVTLFTESGYLMLVKSFTDDLAWNVQRQLVKCYFRAKGLPDKQDSPWFVKRYDGKPIVTLHDFETLTGIELYGRKPFFRPEIFKGGLDFNGLGQGPLRKQFEQENNVHYEEHTFLFLYKSGLRKTLNILEKELSFDLIKEIENGMALAQGDKKPMVLQNNVQEIQQPLPASIKFNITVDTAHSICQVG